MPPQLVTRDSELLQQASVILSMSGMTFDPRAHQGHTTGARSIEASPSHSHSMDLDLHTPRRQSLLEDSLASTVDRHDGLGQGSPSDHSCLDLRKAALLRSHMRRTEAGPSLASSLVVHMTRDCCLTGCQHTGLLKTISWVLCCGRVLVAAG